MKTIIQKSLLVSLAALFFCAVMVFIGVSCKNAKRPSLLDAARARGELVIALEGNWNPWSFHGADGQLEGFDVELVRLICAKLGVNARFVEAEWDLLFGKLQNVKCDVIVNGVAITTERQRDFYFSQPYSYSKTALIVRKDDTTINSFKDLNGKSSANALDSFFCATAEKNGANIIAIDSFEESINMLLENRVESTLNSDVCFYYYKKRHADAPIRIAAFSDTLMPVGIVFRRSQDSIALLNEINHILTQMHSDGTLEKLSIKYFGRDVSK